MRKGKAAVIESLKRGDDIFLSALHALRGVGHWVVQEVTRHLEEAPARPTRGLGSGSKIAAPTPNSFTWRYLDSDGKHSQGAQDWTQQCAPFGPWIAWREMDKHFQCVIPVSLGHAVACLETLYISHWRFRSLPQEPALHPTWNHVAP